MNTFAPRSARELSTPAVSVTTTNRRPISPAAAEPSRKKKSLQPSSMPSFHMLVPCSDRVQARSPNAQRLLFASGCGHVYPSHGPLGEGFPSAAEQFRRPSAGACVEAPGSFHKARAVQETAEILFV